MVESWWNQLKHHAIPEEIRFKGCVPVMEQYALSLLWRGFADGDPAEDLGLAVQCFMRRVNFEIRSLREEQLEGMDEALREALQSWLLPDPDEEEEKEDEELEG